MSFNTNPIRLNKGGRLREMCDPKREPNERNLKIVFGLRSGSVRI